MTRFFVFGGGTAAGMWDPSGGWTQRLKTHLDQKTVETGGNVYSELYPLGVRGDNTNDILERMDEEVESRLKHVKDESEPIVVLFQVGANDAQFVFEEDDIKTSEEDFEENLRKLAERANELADEVIFLGLTPVDDENLEPIPAVGGRSFNNNRLEQYSDLLRETCSQMEDADYIHLFKKFQKSNPEELLEDGLHPNSEGHKLIFETVRKRLQKEDLI